MASSRPRHLAIGLSADSNRVTEGNMTDGKKSRPHCGRRLDWRSPMAGSPSIRRDADATMTAAGLPCVVPLAIARIVSPTPPYMPAAIAGADLEDHGRAEPDAGAPVAAVIMTPMPVAMPVPAVTLAPFPFMPHLLDAVRRLLFDLRRRDLQRLGRHDG